MYPQIRSRIFGLFKVVILACSLSYVIYGSHVSGFITAMARFNWVGLLPALVASFLGYLILALRWRYLVKAQISVKAAVESVFICLCVNNLVPAKMGEIAKAIYLKRQYRLDLGRTLPMVALERILDLMIVALTCIPLFVCFKRDILLLALGLIVFGCFLLMLVVMKRPRLFLRLASKVRSPSISNFLLTGIETLSSVRGKEFAFLFIYSIVLWSVYYAFMLGLTQMATRFSLTPLQVLIVFVLATIGMSVPATPGGLGVVQAGIVLGLVSFGVPKEDAFAFSIVYHMIQYIPTTLIGIFLMYYKGFRWKAQTSRGLP